ncbi:tRNA (adenosine(37)-N6)-dimethylallyltransferase MiaA [Prevotella sp. HUN102]|uniref:tRNA (adenosine(37)-N6)-dimethylallyltransferase MiaA n=1 Tax=Prevotella sp. HUN102 TaxID=1392486 RepID=UPI00048D2686|nr:tRNA (adenosine(37)-N6)-dimethylallyltransferase MiaA [Prevotella sp. HUN102]
MSSKPTLIVVVGPTGIGKTEITLTIARKFDIPVINADSRQIFEELPIGTAAPTKEQQAEIKHYFVGSHHIDDYFSASMYEAQVLKIIEDNASPLYLLSGGSMMYIDAVCNGIDDMPTIRDDVREKMMKRLQDEGLESLCNELKELDPEHWNIVDRNNPRRVVHALEICHQTDKTYTSFRKNTKKERPFNTIKIGLERPREELYDRINQRVLNMIDEGMIQEALNVYEYKHLNSLNTVGYKEIFEYLDGLTTLEEAIFKIQSSTRRYARKQMTWYKKDQDVKWFNPNNIEEILNYISSNLQE